MNFIDSVYSPCWRCKQKDPISSSNKNFRVVLVNSSARFYKALYAKSKFFKEHKKKMARAPEPEIFGPLLKKYSILYIFEISSSFYCSRFKQAWSKRALKVICFAFSNLTDLLYEIANNCSKFHKATSPMAFNPILISIFAFWWWQKIIFWRFW